MSKHTRDARRPDMSIANITPVNTDNVTFEPTGDFMLLELVRADQTEAGVIIPEQFRQGRFPRWRCLAVGPGRHNDDGTIRAPRIKVGDEVMVSPACGRVIEIEGRTQSTILADESAIISIVRVAEHTPNLLVQ